MTSTVFPEPGMRRIWTCPKHGKVEDTTMFMTFEKASERDSVYCLMCIQDQLSTLGLYRLVAYEDVPDPVNPPAQSN